MKKKIKSSKTNVCHNLVFLLDRLHNDCVFFKECSAGYFGENCNSSCGHCLNETACNHINGTCDEECEPGYQAPYCIDGKINFQN